MPRMKILNKLEREAFESPPHFNSAERKRFFSLPKALNDIVEGLRTPANKVFFIVMAGYFRARRKFFAKQFRSPDVEFVARQMGVDARDVRLPAHGKQGNPHGACEMRVVRGPDLRKLRPIYADQLKTLSYFCKEISIDFNLLNCYRIATPKQTGLFKMATAEQTENKSKVLVNVYEPLIAYMKHKFDAACLKRDAYLDKALRIEAGYLRDEVKEPNSDRARNFIAENLKELKLKPLSLSLSTETAELITEVCKEKNIPRDSFINRFFLLLISSETILKALFFFHRGKIEDIEEAYSDARIGYEENLEKYDQINIIDLIEIFSDKSQLCNIRLLLDDEYIIPEGWEWKYFSEGCWHKKDDDNTWVFDSMDGDKYVYIRDNDRPIEEYERGIWKVGDDGSLLLYGSYYKYIENYSIGNRIIDAWLRMDITKEKKITTYSHKFERHCLSILPDEYGFIKTNNLLGLNAYMTDDEVAKEEAFGRTATLARDKLDKLLAFTKLEKTKKATPKDATKTAGEVQ